MFREKKQDLRPYLFATRKTAPWASLDSLSYYKTPSFKIQTQHLDSDAIYIKSDVSSLELSHTLYHLRENIVSHILKLIHGCQSVG